MAELVNVSVVAATPMLCVSVALEVAKFLSPEYVTVTVCEPAASLMLENVTFALDSVEVFTVVPSMTSAALPDGVAVAGATRATVTENFSDVPRAAGLLDDVTVVVL